MANGSKRQPSDQKPLQTSAGMPPGIRITLVAVFGLVALLVAGLILHYALRQDAKPSELGLGTLLTFCLAVLAFVLVPWERFGLSLKKVGPFEFERVIKEQKLEQIRNDVALQERIDDLERRLQQLSGVTSPAPATAQSPDGLVNLIKRFLAHYWRWVFNAARIRWWGADQPGFGDIANYSVGEIDQALQKLFLADQIRARIGKRGNTLYGTK